MISFYCDDGVTIAFNWLFSGEFPLEPEQL
jgi:hypothetical protein